MIPLTIADLLETTNRVLQGSKLILVEGLTGSGKSIMAHFIARQLLYNGVSAVWVHEGKEPHPILIEVDSSIERHMAVMQENWIAYVDKVGSAADVNVLDACFFNNLLNFIVTLNIKIIFPAVFFLLFATNILFIRLKAKSTIKIKKSYCMIIPDTVV